MVQQSFHSHINFFKRRVGVAHICNTLHYIGGLLYATVGFQHVDRASSTSLLISKDVEEHIYIFVSEATISYTFHLAVQGGH